MANTGYKAWANLEEYDASTGTATGNVKPNVDTDPDYVAPVQDLSMCPVPDTTAPSVTLSVVYHDTDSIELSWSIQDDSDIERVTIYYRVVGTSTWNSDFFTVGDPGGFTLSELNDNTNYEAYVVAKDVHGNASSPSNIVTQRTDQAESISVSDSSLLFPSGGGSQQITIYSYPSWTRTDVVSTVDTHRNSGTGDTLVTVSISSTNTSSESAFYSLRFETPNGELATISVEQEGDSGPGGPGGGGGIDP